MYCKTIVNYKFLWLAPSWFGIFEYWHIHSQYWNDLKPVKKFIFTHIPFSLSSFVMILKMCFSSCTKMPVRPTYEGHFDLTTTRKRDVRENMRFHYMLKISPLNWKSGYAAAKAKMCSFVHRHFQMCMTLYLLRQHHGNQLLRASAGSSVGCCFQKKQARSVSKTGNEITPKKPEIHEIMTHLTFLVLIHYIDPQCTFSTAHAEARRVHIYNQTRCDFVSDFRDKHYFHWHVIVHETILWGEKEHTFDVQVWAGIF